MPRRPADGGRGGVAPLLAGDFFAPLEPQLLPFSHSSSTRHYPAHHQPCPIDWLNNGVMALAQPEHYNLRFRLLLGSIDRTLPHRAWKRFAATCQMETSLLHTDWQTSQGHGLVPSTKPEKPPPPPPEDVSGAGGIPPYAPGRGARDPPLRAPRGLLWCAAAVAGAPLYNPSLS